MRPRVFAAEDLVTPCCLRKSRPSGFNEAAGIRRGRLERCEIGWRLLDASMRPRVFAAEDLRQMADDAHTDWAASMRPRVFAAEDGVDGLHVVGQRVASMRPRVFAAEDGGKAIYWIPAGLLQ